MKKSFIIFLVAASLGIASCGDDIKSDAKAWASETCGCLIDDGLSSALEGRRKRGSMQEKIMSCMAENADEHTEFLQNLDDDGRKRYVKELTKALIDTDCVDLALSQAMPMINMVINNVDNLLEEPWGFWGNSKEEAEVEEGVEMTVE